MLAGFAASIVLVLMLRVLASALASHCLVASILAPDGLEYIVLFYCPLVPLRTDVWAVSLSLVC